MGILGCPGFLYSFLSYGEKLVFILLILKVVTQSTEFWLYYILAAAGGPHYEILWYDINQKKIAQ